MNKTIHYTLLLLILAMAMPAYAQMYTGRVLSANDEPVDFATVVLLKANEQGATAITDSAGYFSLSSEDGTYRISIRNIAFEPLEDEIRITAGKRDLGIFRMKDGLVKVNEIVVTASPVTRESDRFVMRINDNLPAFMNKDVSEVLQLAPGVWVTEKGISINGTAGAKVYINDRELKLDAGELMNYLRNYRSTDIAKVEVIPQAGAEYSADSKGGIIRITLRKRQENGYNGSVNMQTGLGAYYQQFRPSFSMNALTGKWTLSGAINGGYAPKKQNDMTETRTYTDQQDWYFNSSSSADGKPKSVTARLGAIYEIDKRNSIGAEWEGWYKKETSPSKSQTAGKTGNMTVSSWSDYQETDQDRNHSVTMNYVHLIDTLGSGFKVIADYLDKRVTGNNDYHSVFETDYGSLDSTYRNRATSNYRIYAADMLLDKHLMNGMKYTAGIRYARNEMSNKTFYEAQQQATWQPIDKFNYALDYVEQIGAAYGSFSFQVGKMSVVAGMRGEYTHTTGKDEIDKSYVDLFPNLNLTYSFNAMKTFLLIGQYARNIERPKFWYLNSNRIQYSDYSYMVGNPLLRPTYINRISLTAVYLYRHTLTFGANLHKDLIREVTKVDPDNPEVKFVTPENHAMENHYFIAISSPLSPANWLSLNTNLIGVKQDIRGVETDRTTSHYLYFINSTANIHLPEKFFLELTYSGTSRLYSANSGIEPSHLFHAQIKRKLANDRLNLSVGIQNIFNRKAAYFARMDNYRSTSSGIEATNSRIFKMTLQYTFNSGKKIKKRSVETRSNTEKERISRSSEIK